MSVRIDQNLGTIMSIKPGQIVASITTITATIAKIKPKNLAKNRASFMGALLFLSTLYTSFG